MEHFSPAGSTGAGLSTFYAPQGLIIGPHPEQLHPVFPESLSCALSGLRRRFWPKRGLQGRSFPWKIWYFLLFEWPAESGRATSSGAADLLVEINFVTDLLAETACNGSNGPVSAKLAVRQKRCMRLASLHSAGPPRACPCVLSWREPPRARLSSAAVGSTALYRRIVRQELLPPPPALFHR